MRTVPPGPARIEYFTVEDDSRSAMKQLERGGVLHVVGVRGGDEGWFDRGRFALRRARRAPRRGRVRARRGVTRGGANGRAGSSGRERLRDGRGKGGGGFGDELLASGD